MFVIPSSVATHHQPADLAALLEYLMKLACTNPGKSCTTARYTRSYIAKLSSIKDTLRRASLFFFIHLKQPGS